MERGTGFLVRTLTAALHQQNLALRESAREALREFVDRSEIPADTAALLTVRGVMGAMLSAATGREGSGAAVEHLVRIAEDGCGGVQPAVLAAVEYRKLTARTHVASPSWTLSAPSLINAA